MDTDMDSMNGVTGLASASTSISSPNPLLSSEAKASPLISYAGLPSMRRLLADLSQAPSTSTATQAYQRKALRRALCGMLDRVNVLGEDGEYGHTGCVNALSWAHGGDLLLSGGDDTTVRLWRLDPEDSSTPYPYKCDSVINTGHTENIFNAHILPSSSRIATVAGDCQVRVFDVERALTTSSQGRETEFTTSETCVRILRCHTGRTKRIVTEESSDVFLTVGEDGAVRQHDLRTPHRCSTSRNNCPAPLVKLPHDLSTLTLSPLAPYLFVVAGEAPHGYLFDRRQTGRILRAEWGQASNDEDYVTCVRRFGRARPGREEELGREHITGARMAQTNGHEVLLSYSSDSVYLYSTRDDPQDSVPASPTVLTPNSKKHKTSSKPASGDTSDVEEEVQAAIDAWDGDVGNEQSVGEDDRRSLQAAVNAWHEVSDGESVDEDEIEDDSDGEEGIREVEGDMKFKLPVILPRTRFSGHCNVETIKDVNFIGPEDEYVASGSDDGNFFLWDKDTGRLHGVYEGDGSVVNVIESHPRLPIIACSGIDTTVKLFAPTEKRSVFSRMENIEQVMANNQSSARRSSRRQIGFASLFLQYRMALRRAAEEGEVMDGEPQCNFQ